MTDGQAGAGGQQSGGGQPGGTEPGQGGPQPPLPGGQGTGGFEFPGYALFTKYSSEQPWQPMGSIYSTLDEGKKAFNDAVANEPAPAFKGQARQWFQLQDDKGNVILTHDGKNEDTSGWSTGDPLVYFVGYSFSTEQASVAGWSNILGPIADKDAAIKEMKAVADGMKPGGYGAGEYRVTDSAGNVVMTYTGKGGIHWGGDEGTVPGKTDVDMEACMGALVLAVVLIAVIGGTAYLIQSGGA